MIDWFGGRGAPQNKRDRNGRERVLARLLRHSSRLPGSGELLGVCGYVIAGTAAPLPAYMNAADDHHATVAGWLDGAEDDLATTPLIIAEVDNLCRCAWRPHFGSYRLMAEPIAPGRSGTERISVPNPR
jgi:hypothetical protein